MLAEAVGRRPPVAERRVEPVELVHLQRPHGAGRRIVRVGRQLDVDVRAAEHVQLARLDPGAEGDRLEGAATEERFEFGRVSQRAAVQGELALAGDDDFGRFVKDGVGRRDGVDIGGPLREAAETLLAGGEGAEKIGGETGGV